MKLETYLNGMVLINQQVTDGMTAKDAKELITKQKKFVKKVKKLVIDSITDDLGNRYSDYPTYDFNFKNFKLTKNAKFTVDVTVPEDSFGDLTPTGEVVVSGQVVTSRQIAIRDLLK